MKNKLITLVLLSTSIFGYTQTAGISCNTSEPACTLPNFQATATGNSAPELAGNNISNPTTNPNPLPGNSGCSFSTGINPNWISITVVSTGVLEFALGQSGGNGYFDWVMWQNTDGNACNDIINNVLPPISCNWNASSSGFTGMAVAGNLPAGANQGNFENAINVNAGDQFVLMFSNYSGILPLNVNVDFNPNNNPNAAIVSCTPVVMPEQTVCQGDSAFVHVPQLNSVGMNLNITSYSWSPSTNIDLPNGGPDVAIFPNDTTWYYVTLTSADSTWLDSVKINVVHTIAPFAGLDDSLCHSTTVGYQFNPTLSNGGNVTWEYYLGPANAPGTPNSIFQPNANSVNATALTNYPGLYQYVLHETDVNDVCPDGTDTIAIYFSKETHTSTFTDPSCFGSNDGSIQITSTGSLGAVLYGFNGVAVNILSDTTGIPAGTYTLISEDAIGCTATSTVTLTDPPQVILTVGPVPDTTVCENGTATLYASAINGNSFSFHWNQTTDLGAIQQINPINDTTVLVYAENELGCFSDILPITVHLHNPITIDFLINDTICPGYDASMNIIAAGGYQGYTYTWTENGNPYTDTDNQINMTPNIQSTYCVTVTDGCESTPKTSCADVIMREVPQPMFAVDTTEGCVPTEIMFYDITQYNLTETQTDSINWVIEGVWYTSDTVNHLFEEVGVYGLTYEIYTQYGCHNSIIVNDYITIHDKPYPNFYVISNPTTIFNTEVDMINNTDGLNNQFQWFFPGGIPASSNFEAPSVLYPEGIAADYPVQLIVTNEFNCVDSTKDVVHVISDVLIYAPNTFTPDGDQKNNTWRVYVDGIDVNDYHLILFNRWGEVIWESYNPEGIWDGTYGSTPVKDGTYVWKVVMKDFNTDKKYEFRGTVNVLR